MMMRFKINILGTKAGVGMWVLRDVCDCEKGFVKKEFKREKGAVIYVREIENNA